MAKSYAQLTSTLYSSIVRFKILLLPLALFSALICLAAAWDSCNTVFTHAKFAEKIHDSVKNAIYGAAGTLLLWLIIAGSALFRTRKKDRFIRFMGCGPYNKICIAMSNTKVWSSREIDTQSKTRVKDGEIEDALCSFTEACVFNVVAEFVASFPGKKFDIIRGLIDSWWESSIPTFSVTCAPHTEKPTAPPVQHPEQAQTTIILGSTNKNSYRRSCIEKNIASLKFCWECSNPDFDHHFYETEKTDKARVKTFNCFQSKFLNNCMTTNLDLNLALIEKKTIDQHTLFFCCGARADDTLMAFKYLLDKWEYFHETYGTDDFSICIGRDFSAKIRTLHDMKEASPHTVWKSEQPAPTRRSILEHILAPFRKKHTSSSPPNRQTLLVWGGRHRGDRQYCERSQIKLIESPAVWKDGILYPNEKAMKIAEKLTISTNKLKEISAEFQRAMVESIEYKKATPTVAPAHDMLGMFDSKMHHPSGNERGEFLAVDFGGTNIRVSVVELDGNGSYHIKSRIITRIKDLGDKDPFEHIAELIRALNITSQTPLGHTFSYPCIHHTPNQAILEKWTKEVKATKYIGNDINAALNLALINAGVHNVRPTAILNDTVSTLLAASYSQSNVSLGSICGTGHNTAFFHNSASTATNIEAGRFSCVKHNIDILNEFDKVHSIDPEHEQHQQFEKLISGAYLGEIFSNILSAESITTTSTPISTIDLARLSTGKCTITTPEYADFARTIATALIKRSARLAAASYHAIISHIDPNATREHGIAIEGSLYYRIPLFKDTISKTLIEMFKDTAHKITIRDCKEGATVGAAVAAAMQVK